MEKSESIKNIGIALIKFKKLVGKIPKSSKNPFYKSEYAELPDILDAVDPHLIECGLALTQWPAGEHELTTLLIHESGEYIMETYKMTPAKNDPQGIGSCITYQRRYAVGAVLSLNIDKDDDGNSASGKNEPNEGKTTPPQNVKKLPDLLPNTPQWTNAVKYLNNGSATIEQIKASCTLSPENEQELIKQSNLQAA
jgi:hypothetical protein